MFVEGRRRMWAISYLPMASVRMAGVECVTKSRGCNVLRVVHFLDIIYFESFFSPSSARFCRLLLTRFVCLTSTLKADRFQLSHPKQLAFCSSVFSRFLAAFCRRYCSSVGVFFWPSLSVSHRFTCPEFQFSAVELVFCNSLPSIW